MSLIPLLKNISFLSGMADAQLGQLADRGHRVTIETNTPIFREGDAADRLYVILSGTVRIFLRHEDGHEVELSVLGQGDFFGEMALLDGGARSASASSIDACTFFVLDRDVFLDLLTTSKSFLTTLMTYLTGTIRITTDKYFQEELARQALRSQMEIERHKSLSQMVAGVAHEINTPLGIVKTAGSILRRGVHTWTEANTELPGLEDMQEALDLVERHIDRAHKLVQSFKNISAGQIVDTKETMNLPESIEEILALFHINARKSHLELDFKHDLIHATWTGYRGHLSRIILNLLTNIERYAYPEGVGGKVEIVLTADEDRKLSCFMLQVRDFGKGIGADHLANVFDPFFTTGRGQGGTGLGLAIVYNLITDALKGSVEIESEIDKGTCITITFPQVIED